MPFYTYKPREPEKSCDYCRDGFDTIQGIREDALETCPECNNPVVRIIYAATELKDKSTKTMLSDDNLKKHGFKKLVNKGGGQYDEVV